MKENLTEIVFILDRSGSMFHLVNDTIGGFNTFIEKQKQEEGEALLTTILFDNQYEVLHNGVNIKDVNPLTDKEYFVRGSTALLDAIGKTINTVKNRLVNTNEEDKPSKVVFVITTDGAENCSSEYSRALVKEMVEAQTKEGWQFLFLGANMDAIAVAQDFGISGQWASNWTTNSAGADSMYMSLSKSVSTYRTSGSINADWKDEIK